MTAPTILWLRRDLRLSDHPALCDAVARGGAVIPLFIRDASVDTLGAAAKWRLGLALSGLQEGLAAVGSRLILRSGDAQGVLARVIAESGAGALNWSRLYDPASIARDTAIKQHFSAQGIAVQSFTGHLLFEPWKAKPASGPFYRVFTPFYKALRGQAVGGTQPAPAQVPPPAEWPASEVLEDWRLDRAMQHAASVLRPYQRVGEAEAQARLAWFCDGPMAEYERARDFPAADATSGLSDNLSLGEISPRQCWLAAERAFQEGSKGAETYRKELVWREFAYHLMFHSPHILTRNWREGWDRFPWITDPEHPHLRAWQQGRTGVPFVDAAMRELYVTGKIHNRARMIAASYLTKHLMIDWRLGQAWFADCLTDWDSASNAMGWQWVAGCGPDAAPYFRIFNPDTQAKRFDPEGLYQRRWLAHAATPPEETAMAFYAAIPRSWARDPEARYPAPVVALDEGRQRALAAYHAYKS